MKKLVALMMMVMTVMSHAEEAVVIDPDKCFTINGLMNYNPSQYPVSNDYVSVIDPKPYVERFRIICDVNNDGVDDLILSDRMSMFGQSDGPWTVYISTNSFWKRIGMVSFHHARFVIERTYDGINILNQGHISGCEDTVTYSRIEDEKVEEGGNYMTLAHYHDNGDGTECISCRICNAISGYPGTHPFRLEESETSTNGIVSWKLIRDNRKPCKVNEIYELKKKLSEAENRAAELEQKVNELSAEVKRYQFGMREFSGVQLGMKWKGGALTRPCEEIFTGFTNMTIKLDADGYVKRIRLTRKEGERTLQTLMNTRNSKAIPEEQKTIHEVENHFRVRLTWGSSAYKNTKTGRPRREYSWGNPLVGNWIDVFFANGDTDESRIDMIYSYDYLRNPGDED